MRSPCYSPLPIHWCCCVDIHYPFTGTVVLTSIHWCCCVGIHYPFTDAVVLVSIHWCCCVNIHYPFTGAVVLESITHSLVLLCWHTLPILWCCCIGRPMVPFPVRSLCWRLRMTWTGTRLSPPSPPHPSPSTMMEQCSTTSKARGRM